ncbi:MAG TPA: helical backbone metal receptor [Bacteroidia bacterium]|nr:helical backbone metal receptor [Bacteroidia bacterium]HNU34216.1 helical backbone metal receptor [Bacteroidia bacterium]
MLNFRDQLNRYITLEDIPQRIISIVPSQTELLYDLGLFEQVVGITKYCVYPAEWLLSKPHVGGTKTLSIKKIRQLQPDLILANKEENTQALIETLEKDFAVWVSDVTDLNDALDMILELGKITATTQKAQQLVTFITQSFNQLEKQTSAIKEPGRAAYLIWRKPYMVAASGTFVNDMMQRCGFTNVFANKQRYPEVSDNDLRQAKPDIILLSSEPFPFRQKHIAEFKMICPWAKVLLVNGEFFAWYGSRLKMAPGYFLEMMNSEY